MEFGSLVTTATMDVCATLRTMCPEIVFCPFSVSPFQSNIIDVSAADSQGMEQHEYMDRARQYSARLAVLSSSLTHWKKLPPLPSLTSQPHQVLASEPIPFSDLQQVSKIAAYAYSALSQICVDEKEELVVQFGIP